MDLLSLIPDNISEVLIKIIRFTESRRRVLQQNVDRANTPGYVPKDLPVLEFAETLHGAIAEHLQHRRLCFRDTSNVHFGQNATLQVRPVVDESAKALLAKDRNKYLESQMSRLLENALNHRVAEELLRHHGGVAVGLPVLDLAAVLADNHAVEESSPHCDTEE